jgi:hypothetical protein
VALPCKSAAQHAALDRQALTALYALMDRGPLALSRHMRGFLATRTTIAVLLADVLQLPTAYEGQLSLPAPHERSWPPSLGSAIRR